MGSLHRVRSRWVVDRARRINTLRGMFRELGHFIAEARQGLLPAALEVLDQGEVPPQLLSCFLALIDDIVSLDQRIETVNREIAEAGQQIPLVQLLYSIPGVGPLTSTALFAFVGDFTRVPSGRHLASDLGLSPREKSSGDRQRLGGISKKGDAYLRMTLIHGARSVLGHMHRRRKSYGRLGEWALALSTRAPFNKVAPALAAKLARIARSVAIHGKPFSPVSPEV